MKRPESLHCSLIFRVIGNPQGATRSTLDSPPAGFPGDTIEATNGWKAFRLLRLRSTRFVSSDENDDSIAVRIN